MAQQYPDWIWQNGAIKPWQDATTHVMAHALHYGSSVFEGIRSYATPDGAAIFRLTDHLKRLYQSAKIYDMVVPYSQDELAAACREARLPAFSSPDAAARAIAAVQRFAVRRGVAA